MENKYKLSSKSRFSDISKFFNDEKNPIFVEFGIGSGLTIKELNERYPDSYIYGFDKAINSRILDKKNKISIHKENLNSFNFKKYPFIKKTDYFLLLDVLEHLENPIIFINHLSELMKNKSTVIVSCPNFSSLRMFFAWVRGRLPKHKYGFFDETHMHWFVPLDYITLFKKKNFSEVKFNYLYSKNFLKKRFQMFWPSRFCSQFILSATK